MSDQDPNYQEAIKAVEKTLADLRGCPDAEREQLQKDIAQLSEMHEKSHIRSSRDSHIWRDQHWQIRAR